MNEVDFTKGFNNGYLLAKHAPEVMSKLTTSIQPENDYFQGMFSGAKQHEMEITKTITKEEPSKTISPDKEHGMEMEKDDY